MKSQHLHDAVELLQTLIEDEDGGKMFKEHAASIITILKSNTELAVEKALLELEELNSLDLPSYLRTQVWDVISLLESVKR